MLQAYHSLAGRYKFQDRYKIPASICRTLGPCFFLWVVYSYYLGDVPWLTFIYHGQKAVFRNS